MSESHDELLTTRHLRALGALDLTGLDSANAAAVLSQPKRLALLVYLAMAPSPYYRRRDTVVSLFWPELDEQHARGALRQALRFLRQALGAEVLVSRGLDEVGVSRRLLAFDVHEFEHAVAMGDRETALEVYAGTLLDGVHASGVAEELESWIAAERKRLRMSARECAGALADEARTQHDSVGSARFAHRAYDLSGHDERDVIRLLHVLSEAGDRSSALRLHDEYARELQELAGALPSPDVQELVEKIRIGSLLRRPAVLPSSQYAPAVDTSSVTQSASVAVSLPVQPIDGGEQASRAPAPLRLRSFSAMMLGLLLLVTAGLVMRRSSAALPASRVAIAAPETFGPTRLDTASVAAREAYVRGVEFGGRRDTIHIRMARDEFLRAIDADPAFADAWVGLSSAYGALAQFGAMPSTEAFALADAAARKALALQPESGKARVRLGATIAFYNWRWAEGERLIREGIARDSMWAEAHDLLADLLRLESRYDEALVEERIAMRLDPLSRHYQFQLGHIQLCAGRNAEALETARAALRLASPYRDGHLLASNALLFLGRYRESLYELALADEAPTAPRFAHVTNDEDAHRILDSLDRAAAEARVRQLEQLPAGTFVSPLKRADAYADVGRWPEVFHWLGEAVRVHDVMLKNQNCQTEFDPIKSDPRYAATMRAVGLPLDGPHQHAAHPERAVR